MNESSLFQIYQIIIASLKYVYLFFLNDPSSLCVNNMKYEDEISGFRMRDGFFQYQGCNTHSSV